ncbi:MAG: hypothetical protein WA117_01750 [Verrucomicrobiia bacterium]
MSEKVVGPVTFRAQRLHLEITLTALFACIAAVSSAQSVSTMERAAEQILRHVTSDGAIVMGPLPAKRSHLIPYFASLAARGLVAAFAETRDARFLDAAKHWVVWHETHMNADGTIYDFDGAPGAWKPTGDYDSTDSYAATYLELILAIHRVAPDRDWLRLRLPAVRQAIAAIRLTLQPNGLTIAKPKWPVMYLMDNTETAAGLRAAEAVGRILGDAGLQRETGAMADKSEQAIARELWDNTRQAYCVGLQTDGAKVNDRQEWYPYVMANLMAVGWLPPSERHHAVLQRFKGKFSSGIPASVRTENDLGRLVWWGIAARGAGDHKLLAEIAVKLAAFDARVKKFTNPALLGHLCRILARD